MHLRVNIFIPQHTTLGRLTEPVCTETGQARNSAWDATTALPPTSLYGGCMVYSRTPLIRSRLLSSQS